MKTYFGKWNCLNISGVCSRFNKITTWISAPCQCCLFSRFSCKCTWGIFLIIEALFIWSRSLNINSIIIFKNILMNVNIQPAECNIILLFHWWRDFNRKSGTHFGPYQCLRAWKIQINKAKPKPICHSHLTLESKAGNC
jgi:hypothetical protein